MSQEKVDSLIIGAGLAGLAAGYTLKKAGHSLKIIDCASRAGGVVHSVWKDQHLLEMGPNTVLPTPDLLDLINELKLDNDMLLADSKSTRYICTQNTLKPLPLSPPGFLASSTISPWGKLRLLKDLFTPPLQHTDETLTDFISRRLGPEISNKLIKPFISGIWAGDADTLSAISTFPKLKSWERSHGSIIKGAFSSKKKSNLPKGLLSFKNGLGTLPMTLSHYLGVDLLLNQKIVSIHKQNNFWEINLGESLITTTNLILSLPAHNSSSLLKEVLPEASSTLEDIPYAPLTVVHMSISKRSVRKEVSGFGFLMGADESTPVLGCLFSSSLFPERCPQDKHLLTVYMGGARFSEWTKKPEDQITTEVHRRLDAILGFREKPLFLNIRTTSHAIPQYVVGHLHKEETLSKIENENPNLRFIGSYRGGISVGDVVKNARATAKTLSDAVPVS